MCLFEQLLLQFHIAEGTSCLIACGRQVVVVMGRGEFHGEEVLLCRCSSDDESDVIGRTCSRSQGLHLLHEEGHQGAWILDACLGLLIEIGLVGRTATLHHAEELILLALSGLDIYLCREVTTCVHLVVHIERSIL